MANKETVVYKFIKVNDTCYVLRIHSTVRGRICKVELRKGTDGFKDYKETPLYHKGNKMYISIEDAPVYLKKRKNRS